MHCTHIYKFSTYISTNTILFHWPCLLPRRQGYCVEVHYRVYSSFMDFYRSLGNNNNNNRSIFIWDFFFKYDILACVETWDLKL
jgi:hypothetical protein